MKVRNIIHGPRARMQRGKRQLRRRVHRIVREFNKRNKDRLELTFTLAIQAMAQVRRVKRFTEKTMHTRAYRRRLDRLCDEARRTGGRIVHSQLRGPRVMPRETKTITP